MTAYRDYTYRSFDDRLDLYARIYDHASVDYHASVDDNAPRLEDNRPPLLLMHGLTRNSSDFDGLAAHLAPHYRLIVPDQRGRAASEYDSDPANYRPQVYAKDMFALLSSLGIAQTSLIGTSMGGLMAMLMATKNPDMFRGIVLNDIGPVLDQKGLDRILGYVGKTEPPTNWEEAALYVQSIMEDAFPDIGDGDPFWDRFARNNFEMSDSGIVARYDPAISQGIKGSDPSAVPPSLWPMWDKLTAMPMLAVRGEVSDLLSAETVAEMGRRHPDNFTAVEIAQRGHAPMLDEDVAVTAITLFLDGLYTP